MWPRRNLPGIRLLVERHIADVGPDGKLTLTDHLGNQTVELYEGLPPAEIYIGGSPAKISLGGIRGRFALVIVEARSGFVVADDDLSISGPRRLASTVSVSLGGYRDIISYWDTKNHLYRLAWTKV